jgi:acylphosphatase
MDNNIVHVSMQVFGKVQGVFFRASTQDKADELGLTGFVQNEKDGSVYLEAEGKLKAIKQLEQWVQVGPSRARVEKVEVKKLDELKGFNKFEQRR